MIKLKAILPIVAITIGCTATEARLASPICPSTDWWVDTAAAGALELCIPPGFERVQDRARWQRTAEGSSGLVLHDFFSVELLSIDEILEDSTPRPPSLLSDTSRCLADCGSIDSLLVHWDSVGRRLVRVEVGLASGGVAGLRRQPILQSSWPVDAKHWVFFQGLAEKPSAFDEFRRALSTVRMVAPPASRPAT